MKDLIFSYLLFLIASSMALSQPMEDADLPNMLEIAEKRVLNHDYVNALKWYEKSYDFSPSGDIAFQIARMNRQLRDYQSAAQWYHICNQLDQNVLFPESRLEYAQMLKMSGQSQRAREAFLFFQRMNSFEPLNKIAALELTGLELANQIPRDDALKVQRLPTEINSRFSESSPHFIDDHTLAFAAFDPDLIADYERQRTSDFTSKVFVANVDNELQVTGPSAMVELPVEEKWHMSNYTVSPDGNLRSVMYSYLQGNRVVKSKFYLQEKINGSWSPGYFINDLGEDLLVKHICFGLWQGKKAIFFDVNFTNGKGKRDIYYAWYLGKGEISNPINLIGPINTIGDEITPFFYKDKLYFSSDGHASFGGYDVFVSEWDGAVWSLPFNLGPGVNSTSDDFYYNTNSIQSKALLVSNRPEGDSYRSKTCCDDIYMVTYGKRKEKKIEIDETAKGIVLNEPVLLPNIYFDYNDARINQSAQGDLRLVKELLEENPTWILELASHTDSRGEKEFNLNLSQRRATNARQYLVDRGVTYDRLKAIGHGENFILNKCIDGVDCTEDEHRYNRRIEFILVGYVNESIEEEKSKGNPVLSFASSFYDFGSLQAGAKKTHTYRFTNTGDGDLMIELATACECTTIDWPTEPIGPGQSGDLVVTYDATDKSGEEEITIDIISNTKSVVDEARFRVFVYE